MAEHCHEHRKRCQYQSPRNERSEGFQHYWLPFAPCPLPRPCKGMGMGTRAARFLSPYRSEKSAFANRAGSASTRWLIVAPEERARPLSRSRPLLKPDTIRSRTRRRRRLSRTRRTRARRARRAATRQAEMPQWPRRASHFRESLAYPGRRCQPGYPS